MHPVLRPLLALALLPLGCVLATPDDLALRGAGDAGRDVAADATAQDAADVVTRPDVRGAELAELLDTSPDAMAMGADAQDGASPGDAGLGDVAHDSGDALLSTDAQDAGDAPPPDAAGDGALPGVDAQGLLDAREGMGDASRPDAAGDGAPLDAGAATGDAPLAADVPARADVQDGGAEDAPSVVVGYATTEWLGELYRDPTIPPQVIVGWFDAACAMRFPGAHSCTDAQYTEHDARARCQSFAGNTYLREPDRIRPALDGGAVNIGLPCWTCGYLNDPMEVPTRRLCPPVQGIARTACCAP